MRSDERGQVLSSLVAVAAVVAIVAGLAFLFGTRGPATTPTSQQTRTVVVPTKASPTTSPTTGPRTTPEVSPSATPTASLTVSPTVPVEDRPMIEVYNNTTRKGLAEQVATRARAAGWTVSGVDNWKGKIVTSTVYFPPGRQSAALALASDLGVSRIKEVLSNMRTDRLTVILTVDYQG
jgi:hypothetical protein